VRNAWEGEPRRDLGQVCVLCVCVCVCVCMCVSACVCVCVVCTQADLFSQTYAGRLGSGLTHVGICEVETIGGVSCV